MKKLLLASAVVTAAIFASGPVFASGGGSGEERPRIKCHNKYDCEKSVVFTLQGEVPCRCKFKLPQDQVVDVFQKQKGPGARNLGTYYAKCNTGKIWLKVRSENGALAHQSIADHYAPYKLKFGAQSFEANSTDGQAKEFIWSSGDGSPVIHSTGTKQLSLESVGNGGPQGLIAGLYSDTVTLTVSGMELTYTPMP
ncbi:hypothetical protein BCT86_08795 [Vibrio breoganii]|uniref:hypothetical protein n=1 Tax=Vibrio breoganii TaxID=553239 RepID=UPI000C83605F|nr:hypothetical protein [Vibrio breoganii]PML08486.1 hypothetical protein BCT86_08795 [Vibrio breoganii]